MIFFWINGLWYVRTQWMCRCSGVERGEPGRAGLWKQAVDAQTGETAEAAAVGAERARPEEAEVSEDDGPEHGNHRGARDVWPIGNTCGNKLYESNDSTRVNCKLLCLQSDRMILFEYWSWSLRWNSDFCFIFYSFTKVTCIIYFSPIILMNERMWWCRRVWGSDTVTEP